MKKEQRLKTLSLISLCTFILLSIPIVASPGLAADESVCARVKLEIRQELTLERQAFDAHMRIGNGFDHITLEDVDVDIKFTDEAGNSILASTDPDNTDALFFYRIDTMDNIDDVDGNGTVAPVTTADIHWLIIPATGASNGLPQGTLYYVGATLTYTIGGEEHVTEVNPDYIFVKPMPELTMDYFLPTDVYGDDAFTQETEPPIPFTLGVRAANNGTGIARNVKIDSAQPKIIDNEQGLLIGFVIEGSEVNGQAATKSLLVNLGDINPNTASVARWIMTCTLSGQFVEFTADWSHSDELGGELTSLLEAVNTHFLVRDVLVDVQGRDTIRDFLAKDGGVYRVYESENVDTEVTDQSGSADLTGGGSAYTLTMPVTAGFIYAQVTDPHAGEQEIQEVIRSDGKHIKLANCWLSKTRDGEEWDHFINIFDANTTGSYTISFAEPAAVNHAPVLGFIPDQTVLIENELSFVVQATDEDGTIPALSAAPLPTMANFVDQGDGTGFFTWTPTAGQTGSYGITFTASDGELTDTQYMTIQVISIKDEDNDGMDDDWEMEHFGNLDRDGSGDYDGDGVSDLDEFINGTDPTVCNYPPTTPVISAPPDESEVTVLQPDLVIENSTDPNGDAITYAFELYADEGMTDLVADVIVPEGTGTTAWVVPIALSDNTWYFWRARATDGTAYSLWAYGSFFVNTANDPPGAFHISMPVDNTEVDTQTPMLEVTNSRDVDEDVLAYTFEVYADSALTTLIASAADISEGTDGATSWTVNTELADATTYYWRAVVADEQGATAETPAAAFIVNTQNGAPAVPTIESPAEGVEVTTQALDLVLTNATDPDGDALTYCFEIDQLNTFDSPAKQSSGEIPEGGDTTSWGVTGLDDNAWYYWRAKASDGHAESVWVRGSFFVNTANEPPSIPTIKNPGTEAWVDTLTPVLAVNPATDPDNDSITSVFAVYADPGLSTLINQGESETFWWTVPLPLNDNTRYYWQAGTRDEHGETDGWTGTFSFFVKDNGVDDPPQITVIEPADDLVTNANSILIRWEDSDPDSNADISLSYDTDNTGADGTLIADALKEDVDGSADIYTWDISGITDGQYYVYASITDGTTPVFDYSPGSVTIDRNAPTIQITPPGGVYTSTQSVTLSTDEPAALYYTLDGSDPTTASTLYTAPIEIGQDTTLKVMARDAIGNQSSIFTESYTFQQELTFTLKTDKGRLLEGIKIYAFTEAGVYTGKNATTDQNGTAIFNPVDFAAGTYQFRVDYLGSQFWSQVIAMPGTSAVELIIEEETVEVTVTTGSGPVEGVRVYLFTEAGSYLGIYLVTDQDGKVTFELPVDKNFKFRADILGNQYWSDGHTITAGGTNSVPLDTAGGSFQITLEKGAGAPMEGITIYLYNASQTYLGKNQVTDAAGEVAFEVPGGAYMVRADYRGYQFWSAETIVMADTNLALTIPHQSVEVTVPGVFQGVSDPIVGIDVRLYTAAGSYVGEVLQTDASGRVSFDLPERPYKVRVDYLGEQYWSEELVWQNAIVAIPMADAAITVTGGGFPQAGVKVYTFTASGSYLGLTQTTDGNGTVCFRLPENTYRFRVDYQGGQYWSAEEMLTADQVNPILISVGGGTFTVTVLTGPAEPLVGVDCYVFDDADHYLGMAGATDANGDVSFDLAEGVFKFRVDYRGYQFWSQMVAIPGTSSLQVMIDEEPVEVTVTTGSGPVEGVKVYLFTEAGSYLGLYRETDQDGKVTFELPVDKNFQFRADILGNQYWSSVITVILGGVNNVSLHAGGGLFQVTVEKAAGSPLQGIQTYLFNTSGTYLGLSQVTDANGAVAFEVPEGTYKVRADYRGYYFWTDPISVTGDTSISLSIPHQQVEVTAAGIFQGASTPLSGVRGYLFTPTYSDLGQYQTTDENGRVVFNLPEKAYKVRIDYMSDQFWSDVFTWQDTLVNVPMADAEVTVTGAGFPQEGIKVYAFTASGTYLNLYQTTDNDGHVIFRLPANNTYKFRADYQGNQFWSGEEVLLADQSNPVIISVGGGTFTFTLRKAASDPLRGVKCYVFNTRDVYLGLSGATDDEGLVHFDLANGSYRFRVDYLGYQFWSPIYDVSTTLSEVLTLTHEDVTITVEGLYQAPEALEGVKTYLFNPIGSYLGLNKVTDASGQVIYTLPDKDYKVRADYLGQQYWSDLFRHQDTTIVIQEGLVRVHVLRAGADVQDARVYLFNPGGSYLGRYKSTNTTGEVEFVIPVGTYQFRVDDNGEQRWSAVVEIQAGVESSVEVTMD